LGVPFFCGSAYHKRNSFSAARVQHPQAEQRLTRRHRAFYTQKKAQQMPGLFLNFYKA